MPAQTARKISRQRPVTAVSMRTLAVRGLRWAGLLAILATGAAGCWPLAVFADAAPPWEPGDAIGEPTGAVAHVAITHEDLAFDLRALASANPVQVRATYQLRNDAAPTSASLVFLADHALTGASTFAVTFDGAAVAATPTTLTQLPNAWKPPTSTPSLIDGADVPYDTKPGTAFQFTALIPPGPHRLSVAYTVMPGRYSWAGKTTIWQVAYVLAPARQWASFGDLSVRVQLPPGWRARALPDLTRNGNTLEGQFSGLPADGLVMSASFPVDAHVMSIPEWMAPLWPLFFGLLLITVVGAAAVPLFTKQRWAFILSGVMWAVPAVGLWMSRAFASPPETQYGAGKCGAFMIGCALLPGALLIAVIAAGVGVLAVVIPLFVAAAIWARVRRPA
jgi:hypothetical protein